MVNWVMVIGELLLCIVMLYGVVLGILGFGLLVFYINFIVVFFVVFGYVIYVGVYSLYMK